MNDDAQEPLAEDDLALLAVIATAQEKFDPMPEGMLARLEFAVSVELLNVEIDTVTETGLTMTPSDTTMHTDPVSDATGRMV